MGLSSYFREICKVSYEKETVSSFLSYLTGSNPVLFLLLLPKTEGCARNEIKTVF